MPHILYLFQITLLSKELPKEKNTKINEKAVRDFYSRYENFTEGWAVAKAIDTIKVEQFLFLKDVPSERLNGLFNLLFALTYPNATSEEIESALVNICRDTKNI